MSDDVHEGDGPQAGAGAGAGAPPRLSCLIVTSPRTGSWLLSDILSLTGLVGQPDEYFRLDFARDVIKDYGLKTKGLSRAYLEGIVTRTATPNGVFAAKIHPHHFDKLVAAIRSLGDEDDERSNAELIEAWFPNPRYVHLTRLDTRRQAISYYRALLSGVWWALDDDEGGARAKGGRRPGGSPRVRPDYLQIKWLEDLVVRYEEQWDEFFSSSGITPHEVVYEDLVENTERVVLGVLEYLGIELPDGFTVPASRVRRLADRSTERQLRAYLSLRDQLPPIPDDWTWNLDARAFTPMPRPATEPEDGD